MPRPPAPADFQAYGFAGIIFGSFFFLVCFVILMGGRYFSKRDEVWAGIQEKRDQQLREALDRRDTALRDSLGALSVSHERAVDRVAASAEKTAETSAGTNREITAALKELQGEVKLSHRALSEDTIYSIMRRAVREAKQGGES